LVEAQTGQLVRSKVEVLEAREAGQQAHRLQTAACHQFEAKRILVAVTPKSAALPTVYSAPHVLLGQLHCMMQDPEDCDCKGSDSDEQRLDIVGERGRLGT